MFVPISALNGDGIDDLLDNINLLAEVGEYKANTDRHGEGSVLEERCHPAGQVLLLLSSFLILQPFMLPLHVLHRLPLTKE